MEIFMVHTDGGARGNPGPSGIGITLADSNGATVAEVSEYIGEGTNNVAEYTAVKRAFVELERIAKNPAHSEAHFFLDSQLVERQLNGVYKIKEPTLKVLAGEVQALRTLFQKTTFTYIPREKNKRADELANEAMDKQIESR
jgi:ribonuclease HI